MPIEKIDICYVYRSRWSKIECFEKWRRFYSKEQAQKFIEKREKKKNHLFIRYILVNNVEVEKL